jgi:hypothetical protein
MSKIAARSSWSELHPLLHKFSRRILYDRTSCAAALDLGLEDIRFYRRQGKVDLAKIKDDPEAPIFYDDCFTNAKRFKTSVRFDILAIIEAEAWNVFFAAYNDDHEPQTFEEVGAEGDSQMPISEAYSDMYSPRQHANIHDPSDFGHSPSPEVPSFSRKRQLSESTRNRTQAAHAPPAGSTAEVSSVNILSFRYHTD